MSCCIPCVNAISITTNLSTDEATIAIDRDIPQSGRFWLCIKRCHCSDCYDQCNSIGTVVLQYTNACGVVTSYDNMYCCGSRVRVSQLLQNGGSTLWISKVGSGGIIDCCYILPSPITNLIVEEGTSK